MRRVAKDSMHAQVIPVVSTMSLREVATLCAQEGITGAPVLDEVGHLGGVISQTDLVAYALAEAQELTAAPPFDRSPVHHGLAAHRGFSVEALRPEAVQDVMTSSLITVAEDTPLPEVAARMVPSGVHRLIVVDGDQELQGSITSLEVLRWVAAEVRFQADLAG